MIIGMETSSGGGGSNVENVYIIGSNDANNNMKVYKGSTEVYTKGYSSNGSYEDDNISLVQIGSSAATLNVTLKKDSIVISQNNVFVNVSDAEVMPSGTVLTHFFSGSTNFQWYITC